MPTIKGTKFTEEHRRNLSLALMGKNKGKVMSVEARKKMSKAKKGIRFTKEHRMKIGLSNKATIAKQGHPWTGKKHKAGYFEKVSGWRNVNWKGKDVGYTALHAWVRKYLGKPNKCEFCGVEENNPNRFEWANKSGEYKRELTDWIRLCKKCHCLFDKKRRENANQ